MAASHGDLRHLLPGNYKRQIADWLEEDCPSLDYGGFVVGESEGEARLLGKSQVSHVATQLYQHIHKVICTNTMAMHRVSLPVSPSSMRSFLNSVARSYPPHHPSQPPPSPNPLLTNLLLQHRMAR
jgi:hypothetical protein